MFERICAEVSWCRHDVLEATLELAIEIAREGREGRRVGTLFTLGLGGHPKPATDGHLKTGHHT